MQKGLMDITRRQGEGNTNSKSSLYGHPWAEQVGGAQPPLAHSHPRGIWRAVPEVFSQERHKVSTAAPQQRELKHRAGPPRSGDSNQTASGSRGLRRGVSGTPNSILISQRASQDARSRN